jgi:hypothetical protein
MQQFLCGISILLVLPPPPLLMTCQCPWPTTSPVPHCVTNPILCAAINALHSALDKGYRIARPPILTLQYCIAVSIDTCFAVARFFSWFWRVNSQYVTPGLSVRCATHLCTLYTVPHQLGLMLHL